MNQELQNLLSEFNEDSKEYKLFNALITEITELNVKLSEYQERIDEIDEDLADVEDELYIGETAETFEDDEVFELDCPHCGMKLYIDEGILEQDEMNCPSCGQKVTFDLDTGDNNRGCGGCCGSCGGC